MLACPRTCSGNHLATGQPKLHCRIAGSTLLSCMLLQVRLMCASEEAFLSAGDILNSVIFKLGSSVHVPIKD
jgi:hypothetical protein